MGSDPVLGGPLAGLAEAPSAPVETLTGPATRGWLSRNVFALGLTSFFSDFSHEMATAILPAFLLTIGGSAAALGIIEGVADAISSFVKIWAGSESDRFGRRKPFAVTGYAFQVVKALFGFATAWPQVLVLRSLAWVGRGIRTPVRDAMLADAVPPWAYGRAFGFHRAMDTLGAIAGPAVAVVLVSRWDYRYIFLLTGIPGLLAVLSVGLLVREARRPPRPEHRLILGLRGLPSGFRRFLIAVGLFGIGNFAHSLLILRASQTLGPLYGMAAASAWAIALYTGHNVLYAAASYPVGVLSEKLGKRLLLGLGYLLFAATSLGFALAPSSLGWLTVLFALAGIYIALVDAMEGALAADLLPERVRGTGYGALASVNGVGDLISSMLVGILWTAVSPLAGFGYAAATSLAAAALLGTLQPREISD